MEKVARKYIGFGAQDDGSYVVPTLGLEMLDDLIAKANRRATKLGTSKLAYEIMGSEVWAWPRKGQETAPGRMPVTAVRFTGEVPRVAGYEFLARVEHHDAGNIVTRAPGRDATVDLDRYRTANSVCDHCGTRRYRRDTFVLRSPTGELTQIGRSCLADYLKGGDLASALQVWRTLDLVLGALGGDAPQVDDDALFSGGSRGYAGIDPVVVLSHAFRAVRTCGWVSRAEARDRDVQATSNLVVFSTGGCPMDPHSAVDWRDLQPEACDVEQGRAAVEWIRSFVTKPKLSDYEHNLLVNVSLGYVTHRHMGLVTSAVVGYQRSLEQAVNRAKRAKRGPSVHVGQVGERMTFDRLTVTRTRFCGGNYGVTTIVALEDSAGNELTWFASGERTYDPGDLLTGKGTIKSHGDYQGRPQTVITRCKFEVIDVEDAQQCA